ncbi:MAG: hypothetical protein GC162_10370 [Planctomycetes bacterium]|nr:hypothetical protein [Planctomycetota bacterium]
MADLKLKVLTDPDWQQEDKLQMVIGSENVESLADSSPAGGEVTNEVELWPGNTKGGFGSDALGEAPFGYSREGWGFGQGEFGYGLFGVNDVPRTLVEARVLPEDRCAVLPIGARTIDAIGNVSDVTETLVGLDDRPSGPLDPSIASTGQPLEARLTWTLSPDV